MEHVTVLTRRDIIKRVARRWAKQYPENDERRYDFSPRAIQKKLDALNLETVEPEVIDEIIGNNSWTTLQCTFCCEDVEKALELDTNEYVERLCERCLGKMNELIKAVK